MDLRPYQKEALAALWAWFKANPEGAPLVVLPTGAGKSVSVAEAARQVAARGLDRRVLVVQHRQELIGQNCDKFRAIAPFIGSGVYSSGLGRREAHQQVVFAGIQSVFRRAADLGPFSLAIVDECHLVPTADVGMYRSLIDGLRAQNPAVRFAGLTATPYRLGSGLITQGDDPLFTDVAYDANISDLIRQGYLAPLVSKSCVARPDVGTIALRGGEYVTDAMEKAFNRLDLVEAAVEEVVRYGADRKSWLVFASGVAHAHRIHEVLERVGVPAAVLTGETLPLEREGRLSDFKAGKLRALVNCDVLTTGFDFPGIDLIAVLRATKSTALWVQMCGRGSRLADGKKDCLILDFGGNALEHGPLDTVRITYRRNPITGKKEGTVEAALVKECPGCRSLTAITARECPDCGMPFPEPVRLNHEAEASDAPILSGQPSPTKEVDVVGVKFRRWDKADKPHPTMRVDYVLSALAEVPIETVPEWVCFEHTGFAREKAVRWWLDRVEHHEEPVPQTVDEAISRAEQELRVPKRIAIQRDGQWWRVVKVLEFQETREEVEADELWEKYGV
jgi:DNA repair protein RadD